MSKVKSIAVKFVARGRRRDDDIQRWELRAEKFGPRAVFHLGHPEDELDQVTRFQKERLYPLFRAGLRGDERLVLDLGCGTGRFTPDLAKIVSGRAIGVDPIARLLERADQRPGVEYRVMRAGTIPVATGSVDIVWICLVLGGIRGDVLDSTIHEIHRVLKPGGLVFLVENTTEGLGNDLWAFRSFDEYSRLMAPLVLDHLDDYEDLGERVSIFMGRYRDNAQA